MYELGRGIISAVLPIQLCVRRKAAFNKSLIKGKQRGRRFSSILVPQPSFFLSSFSLPLHLPLFSLVDSLSDRFYSIPFLSFPLVSSSLDLRDFSSSTLASVLLAPRDYAAGQNTGSFREVEREKEGGGTRKKWEEKTIREKKDRSCHARVVLSKTDSFFALFFYLSRRNPRGSTHFRLERARARARTQVSLLFV